MAILKTEAITLRRRRTREADALLTLYCQQGGKILASTRSVMKTTSRLAGVTQPFNHLHVILYEKVEDQEIKSLTQVSLMQSFDALRSDIERMGVASCLAEWVERLSPDSETNLKIWNLLLSAFRRWNEKTPRAEELIFYQWHLLIDAGVSPGIQSCPSCGREQALQWYYRARQGVLYCDACVSEGTPLQSGAVQALRQLGLSGEPPNLRLSEQQKREIHHLLQDHLEYHLEIRPKTNLFLQQWQQHSKSAQTEGPNQP
jgi:DNA repair protein RecO (recombination protein O)